MRIPFCAEGTALPIRAGSYGGERAKVPGRCWSQPDLHDPNSPTVVLAQSTARRARWARLTGDGHRVAARSPELAPGSEEGHGNRRPVALESVMAVASGRSDEASTALGTVSFVQDTEVPVVRGVYVGYAGWSAASSSRAGGGSVARPPASGRLFSTVPKGSGARCSADRAGHTSPSLMPPTRR